MRLAQAFLFATSLVSTAVSTAHAVPSPANSTVDPCLIICPRGDFTFHVVVRDGTNTPVGGSAVVIDFCPFASLHLCFPLTGCTIQGITNASGSVSFAIEGGGVTPPAGQVTVRADGVQLASRPVASPDQDGSLIVDGTDFSIANGKLGNADPTADLDCDQGGVDAADLTALQAHFGHTCGGPTSNGTRTWGRVKTIYR